MNSVYFNPDHLDHILAVRVKTMAMTLNRVVHVHRSGNFKKLQVKTVYVYSFIYLFIYLFTYLCVYSFSHLFLYLFVYSFQRNFN